MILVLKNDVTDAQIEHIMEKIRDWGGAPHLSQGEEKTIIGVIGDEATLRVKPVSVIPGVDTVMSVMKPYKLAGSAFQASRTVIEIPPVNDKGETVTIGGDEVVVMAGPCSVESRDLLFEITDLVKKSGAGLLRAGAFKPRTSPYAFQGLGVKGLRYLAEAREKYGIPFVTEVMDTRDVELVAEFADIIQIGARNMQNFNLMKAVGRCHKPVLIKRGLSSTLQELLMSAEYVMSQGNREVILCERGIRTFETMTRNTLDISAVPVLKRETHLPIIVDPSHGTGHWPFVAPMAMAAVAAGADGVMIEVHTVPEEAMSDGPQSLLPHKFDKMMKDLAKVAEAVGRRV
ncbi:MAG: 3-deoxy-7-phosphoheptulonate synthase [Spartobacteria bacterium]|nr:3-deoxy-7-phosphoheptulonate synthase [Spartobacteria bacterium]